jgi:hypothetical protein
LKENPNLFRDLGFLDRFDILSINPKIKHSNIVEVAKASLFTLRAQLQVDDSAKIRYLELAAKHWKNSSPNTPDYCVQYADVLFKQAATLKRYKEQHEVPDYDEQMRVLGSTSEEYFSRAAKLDPGNAYIYFRFAQSLEFFGEKEMADIRFLQSLLIDPSALEVVNGYALFLSEYDREIPKYEQYSTFFRQRAEQASDLAMQAARSGGGGSGRRSTAMNPRSQVK